jgi:hypothetical protein
MPTGSGTKGIRDYDWAMIEVTSDDSPEDQEGGHSALLVRRHRCTRVLSYYRCWTPQPAPLARLIAVAVARWRTEEDHQQARQCSALDKGQVTCWASWHRWTVPCLLAYIYLTVAVALERAQDAETSAAAEMIAITVPELARLLRGAVIPPPARTGRTSCTGPTGAAATSTAPAWLTSAGTPTPTSSPDHNELQLPCLSHACSRRHGRGRST